MSVPLGFPFGVASGDPTHDSVVIWTAHVGSPADRLAWQVSTTPTFESDAVRRGETSLDGGIEGARVRIARVVVDGLDPGRHYWYRFVDGPCTSPIGHTATLPVQATERLRLGVACCAHWLHGDFDAYGRLADADPDVVLHLGDYIYETGGDGPRGPHEPNHECATVEDFDRRYAQYRSDPDLGRLHAAAPWVSIWDDHEFADDAWRGGSHAVHDAATSWRERSTAAQTAHARWMPQRVHGNGPTPVDRSLSYGDLADVVLVDARFAGRERPKGEADGPSTALESDAARQLLSDDQWEWLHGEVARSTARWLILCSSVQVSPLRLAYRPTWSWPPRLAPVINPDQWDGYPDERRRLVDLLVDGGRVGSTLLLSGDLHGRFVTGVATDHGVLPEVTTPAVSSPTFASTVRSTAWLPGRVTEAVIRLLNRHVRDLDLDTHGTTLVDVTPDELLVHGAPSDASWKCRHGRTDWIRV